MKSKLAQNIGTKNKKVWDSAIFGANITIDYITFSDNLEKRKIIISRPLAKQLFDQLAPSGKINRQEMNDMVRPLNHVKLPSDMNDKLKAQLVLKRVLLAAASDKPFNADDFWSNLSLYTQLDSDKPKGDANINQRGGKAEEDQYDTVSSTPGDPLTSQPARTTCKRVREFIADEGLNEEHVCYYMDEFEDKINAVVDPQDPIKYDDEERIEDEQLSEDISMENEAEICGIRKSSISIDDIRDRLKKLRKSGKDKSIKQLYILFALCCDGKHYDEKRFDAVGDEAFAERSDASLYRWYYHEIWKYHKKGIANKSLNDNKKNTKLGGGDNIRDQGPSQVWKNRESKILQERNINLLQVNNNDINYIHDSNQSAQSLSAKNKEIWNAVSDSGADEVIDYKTFSDNLKDRGIIVLPLLAKQLFDQLALSTINHRQMDAIVRQLDRVKLPSNFTSINCDDMSSKLRAQLVMKRILLAASSGEPFNPSDFVFVSKCGVNIHPIQFMNILTDGDPEWYLRVYSMAVISANIGTNPMFNKLLANTNIAKLLSGWCTLMLDNKPEVQKNAVRLMPNIFHECLDKGDPQITVGHLKEILDNLFKVLNAPKCASNYAAAKDAISKVVDDVINMQDSESMLGLVGLLTAAPSQAFALKQVQKIISGSQPAKTVKLDVAGLSKRVPTYKKTRESIANDVYYYDDKFDNEVNEVVDPQDSIKTDDEDVFESKENRSLKNNKKNIKLNRNDSVYPNKYNKHNKTCSNQTVIAPKNPLPPYVQLDSNPSTQQDAPSFTDFLSTSHDGDKQAVANCSKKKKQNKIKTAHCKFAKQKPKPHDKQQLPQNPSNFNRNNGCQPPPPFPNSYGMNQQHNNYGPPHHGASNSPPPSNENKENDYTSCSHNNAPKELQIKDEAASSSDNEISQHILPVISAFLHTMYENPERFAQQFHRDVTQLILPFLLSILDVKSDETMIWDSNDLYKYTCIRIQFNGILRVKPWDPELERGGQLEAKLLIFINRGKVMLDGAGYHGGKRGRWSGESYNSPSLEIASSNIGGGGGGGHERCIFGGGGGYGTKGEANFVGRKRYDNGGKVYGDKELTIKHLGSGGGGHGFHRGGNGGGAVYFVSYIFKNYGQITVNGEDCINFGCGAGSGGSIFIIAAEFEMNVNDKQNCFIYVTGGKSKCKNKECDVGDGGDGRIRIETLKKNEQTVRRYADAKQIKPDPCITTIQTNILPEL